MPPRVKSRGTIRDMPLSLKLHPQSGCAAVSGIAATVTRPQPDTLALSYVVSGTIGEVRWPDEAAPARTDGLWQHTCFEAFIRPSPGAGYCEFNFAPSREWAAYQFDGYRAGMRAAEIGVPAISGEAAEKTYTLRATLHWDRLSDLMRDNGWRLGLAAIIEETGGRKSYWALAHPPGKPDFHHADCFALEFPEN
jgi:hypothetical protein